MDAEKLKNYPIFSSMEKSEIEKLISSSGSFFRKYKKGSVIISEGDVCLYIWVITCGTAVGESIGEDGRREDVAVFSEGNVFGDILAMSPSNKSPVTVFAMTDIEVLCIPFEGVVSSGSRFVFNLASLISHKYLDLLFRTNCISKPKLRDKILFYLHRMSVANQSNVFEIPYNREELAVFLCAERSALSRELCKMKKEKIINFRKNRFEIL